MISNAVKFSPTGNAVLVELIEGVPTIFEGAAFLVAASADTAWLADDDLAWSIGSDELGRGDTISIDLPAGGFTVTLEAIAPDELGGLRSVATVQVGVVVPGAPTVTIAEPIDGLI